MSGGLGPAFQQIVEDGTYRLHRRMPVLLATGTVGGIDVSMGVLASLLVLRGTDSDLLSALAFGIGFVALLLARSELFTENFLVPLAAVAARNARFSAVGRLWLGTGITNLLGGCATIAIVSVALPDLGPAALEKATVYVERGLGGEAFASAVLAGIVITLMTWMQQGTDSTGAKLVAAVLAAFLLSYAHLSHVIVASLEVFAGLLAGGDFHVGDWAAMFVLWATGNAVGGIGMVTMLRLVQVGPRRLRLERERRIEETDESMADVDQEAAPGDAVTHDTSAGDERTTAGEAGGDERADAPDSDDRT